MQAKRLLAKKKAAAQKKSATSAAALAAAREAKERAKKAKGKKDTSHFNQVCCSPYCLGSVESAVDHAVISGFCDESNSLSLKNVLSIFLEALEPLGSTCKDMMEMLLHTQAPTR